MGGIVAGTDGPSFLLTLPLVGCVDVVVDGYCSACLSCGINATSVCCGTTLVRAWDADGTAALDAVSVRLVVGWTGRGTALTVFG
jgi:hypothetical protein